MGISLVLRGGRNERFDSTRDGGCLPVIAFIVLFCHPGYRYNVGRLVWTTLSWLGASTRSFLLIFYGSILPLRFSTLPEHYWFYRTVEISRRYIKRIHSIVLVCTIKTYDEVHCLSNPIKLGKDMKWVQTESFRGCFGRRPFIIDPVGSEVGISLIRHLTDTVVRALLEAP